jgi:hypothetical protein
MLSAVLRMALRKGLLGGSRPWLIVGVAATGLRIFSRLARRQPVVVYRDKLDAGQSLVISHFPRSKG